MNIIDLTTARFEGPADNAKDFDRLCNQLERIHDLMIDGAWRTLAEIEGITGDPQASISAQLRHLRKHRYGAHDVDKRRREYPRRGRLDSGTWEYSVTGGLCNV
jgi:hypothetical protein